MAEQHVVEHSFRPSRLRESSRLAALAVRLAWRAGALFVVGIVALLVVQAALSPLQLVLTRAVIDRAAVDLGLLADAGSFVARLPLGAWIVLAVVAVAVGQLDPTLLGHLAKPGGGSPDRLRDGAVDPRRQPLAGAWPASRTRRWPTTSSAPAAMPRVSGLESDRPPTERRPCWLCSRPSGFALVLGGAASASPLRVGPCDPAPSRSAVELR